MIAHVDASGLGLPDRDYYLKPEDRFVEARAKYHEHLIKMFVLAGSDVGSGGCGCDLGVRAGKALCGGDARQRREPRSASTGSQDAV